MQLRSTYVAHQTDLQILMTPWRKNLHMLWKVFDGILSLVQLIAMGEISSE